MKIQDHEEFVKDKERYLDIKERIIKNEMKSSVLKSKYELELKKLKDDLDSLHSKLAKFEFHIDSFLVMTPSHFVKGGEFERFSREREKEQKPVVVCDYDTLEVFTPIGLSLDFSRILDSLGNRHSKVRVY